MAYGGLPAGHKSHHPAKPRDPNCSDTPAGDNGVGGGANGGHRVGAWGGYPQVAVLQRFCLSSVDCCTSFLKQVSQKMLCFSFCRSAGGKCWHSLSRSLNSARVTSRAWQIKKFCPSLFVLSSTISWWMLLGRGARSSSAGLSGAGLACPPSPGASGLAGLSGLAPEWLWSCPDSCPVPLLLPRVAPCDTDTSLQPGEERGSQQQPHRALSLPVGGCTGRSSGVRSYPFCLWQQALQRRRPYSWPRRVSEGSWGRPGGVNGCVEPSWLFLAQSRERVVVVTAVCLLPWVYVG